MARCTNGAATARSRLVHVRSRATSIVSLVTLVVVSLGVVTAPAAAQPPGRYIEPVGGGVIIDHFRPPRTPYGPGNRGVDEQVAPATPVVASADGEVLFAGEVAGQWHVTLRHGDGLRTTYSYLAAVAVKVGQHVTQGTVLGLSATLVHFGVRDPSGAYLDPEALWAGRLGAHLVPGPDDHSSPQAATDERDGSMDVVQPGSPPARRRALAAEAAVATGRGEVARFSAELRAWPTSAGRCTPPEVAAPSRGGRRVAVLVGGLGSSSDSAAVDRVDVRALGYRSADVIRFSYRGGRSPDRRGDHGPLDVIAVEPYGPDDTTGDLREAAGRLEELLAAVRRQVPGVPVDVIAHSQGGVVARLALDEAGEGASSTPDLLVTLATPHQGAELATAAEALGGSGAGAAFVDRLGEVTGLPSTSVAVSQLSETSDVIAQLARPVPHGVPILSIGASGDMVVPAGQTVVEGATNVIVHLGGWQAHDQLPAQPSVIREIALARAGMAPRCVGWDEVLSAAVVAHGIARAETLAGLGLAELVGS